MITEFQDGFITKTKLNELVGGINANSEGIIDINVKLEDMVAITVDTTKTVGTGGDFVTLTEALNWCKRLKAIDCTVTLNLLSGYIWNEDIILNKSDLGFVIITSVDATVNHVGTENFKWAITATDSVCPTWDILLNSSVSYNGMKLSNSKIKIFDGGGIKNSLLSLNVSNDSTIFITLTAYFNNDNGKEGEVSISGSTIIGENLYVTNFSSSNSKILFNKLYMNSSTTNALIFSGLNTTPIFKVFVSNSFTLFADNSSINIDLISTSGTKSIQAKQSTINILTSGIFLSSIYAINGSKISFSDNENVTIVSATVMNGSFICAKGSTISGVSQTVNTITSNGIIFK